MNEKAEISGNFCSRLSTLFVYAASPLLVAFMLLLLGTTYLSQQSLREAADHELWYNLEKRASTLGYFYSERKTDINNLLKDRSVSTYFANKALGMSMEYGLRASLISMRKSFRELVESKRIDGSPIYLRLMFIDKAGKILVDDGLSKGQMEPWLDKWSAGPRDIVIRLFKSELHEHLIISTSYFYKGNREGSILAEINHERVFNKLVSWEGEEAQSHLFISEEADGRVAYSHVPGTLPSSASGSPAKYQRLASDQAGAPIKLPIPGTRFILGAIDAPRKHEYLTSRWYLISLTLLATLVFSLVVISKRARAKNRTLQTSIFESKQQSKQLEELVAARTRDISIAKNELEEAHQRLQLILDTIPVRVFWKDRNLTYRGCNRLFAEDAGLNDPNELVGLTDFDMGWRDQAELYQADDKRIMETQQDKLEYEEPQTTPQGKKIWLLTSKIPLRDINQEVIGILGAYSDITERKETEEQLKAARKSAEQANQAKSTFLANMSHELRTPMHAILSFSQIGLDKVESASKDRLKKYFSNIKQSGDRLLLLLNDLLDLSKLEAGRMQFEFDVQDFVPVIESQRTELQELLNNKSLKLKLESTVVDTTACFDYQKMLQVIRNLLSNAIKFTSEGKTISICLANGDLRTGRRYGDTETVPALSITVSDQGEGIPDDELESIFDKFVQSSKTKTGAGGTGLGLAICQEIVHGHDGSIHAKNNALGGAAFTVTIPRRRLVQDD